MELLQIKTLIEDNLGLSIELDEKSGQMTVASPELLTVCDFRASASIALTPPFLQIAVVVAEYIRTTLRQVRSIFIQRQRSYSN